MQLSSSCFIGNIIKLFFDITSSSFVALFKVEKAATDAVDKKSETPESKSDCNDQSSSPGTDSDHDYTVIGGNSPTQTEER